MSQLDFKTFEANFPPLKNGQSYEEYCLIHFGNTAYKKLGKKLLDKSEQEVLDEASDRLKAEWRAFNGATSEDDWYQIYSDMPELFYSSLFPRQLDINDQVGPNAPWERGN